MFSFNRKFFFRAVEHTPRSSGSALGSSCISENHYKSYSSQKSGSRPKSSGLSESGTFTLKTCSEVVAGWFDELWLRRIWLKLLQTLPFLISAWAKFSSVKFNLFGCVQELLRLLSWIARIVPTYGLISSVVFICRSSPSLISWICFYNDQFGLERRK